MWEIVLSVFGAAVIAGGGWLVARAIHKWDKLADELKEHEKQCNKRWDETTTILGVHGEKLSNLEKGQERLEKGQAGMDDKLNRILEKHLA